MSHDPKRIVAVALLSAEDVELLGDNFRRVYPVDESPCFGKLLRDIDEAERQLGRSGKASHG